AEAAELPLSDLTVAARAQAEKDVLVDRHPEVERRGLERLLESLVSGRILVVAGAELQLEGADPRTERRAANDVAEVGAANRGQHRETRGAREVEPRLADDQIAQHVGSLERILVITRETDFRRWESAIQVYDNGKVPIAQAL